MEVVLVMVRADGQRRSFSITRDITVIGRREESDLRIPLPDVSRKHCRLIRAGGTLRVEDLGSSNGTHRNGTRIQQSVLTAGDRLAVGPVQFVVQIDGRPDDAEVDRIGAGRPTAVAGGPVTDDDIADALADSHGSAADVLVDFDSDDRK